MSTPAQRNRAKRRGYRFGYERAGESAHVPHPVASRPAGRNASPTAPLGGYSTRKQLSRRRYRSY